MVCEKYKEWLQEYHDGRLVKTKEPVIFVHLSSCQECRDFYRTLSMISEFVSEEINGFPRELDENILRSLIHEKPAYNRGFFRISFPAYISYALLILVAVISLFYFSSSAHYQNELRRVSSEMREQNKKMEYILNSMPEVTVTARYAKDIIVQ